MTGTIVILGAKGRFGRAATEAFRNANWQVRAFARAWNENASADGIEYIEGDAFNAQDVTNAARGCDVIINALNPPYSRWQADLPRLTDNVIHAAKQTSATVMIPGNVYNFGETMPVTLDDSTLQQPSTRKGKLRVAMEETYKRASIQTVVLYGGDFIEREKTGNWFDSQIAVNANKGIVMYPGPLDRVHAWAYLPDMARAMVGLAEKRHELGAWTRIGFDGHSVTGRQLISAIETATGRRQFRWKLPLSLIRLLGMVSAEMREVAEMGYLWHVPHQIDGTSLAATLPDYRPTPLDRVMRNVLAPASLEPANKALELRHCRPYRMAKG